MTLSNRTKFLLSLVLATSCQLSQAFEEPTLIELEEERELRRPAPEDDDDTDDDWPGPVPNPGEDCRYMDCGDDEHPEDTDGIGWGDDEPGDDDSGGGIGIPPGWGWP